MSAAVKGRFYKSDICNIWKAEPEWLKWHTVPYSLVPLVLEQVDQKDSTAILAIKRSADVTSEVIRHAGNETHK